MFALTGDLYDPKSALPYGHWEYMQVGDSAKTGK